MCRVSWKCLLNRVLWECLVCFGSERSQVEAISERIQKLEPLMEVVPDMVAFFERYLGDFPDEKPTPADVRAMRAVVESIT